MPTIAVTGHRPNKLGGYDMLSRMKLNRFARFTLETHYPEHRTLTVVTGMALGWDQAIAQACIDLNIPFIAAVPFTGQELVWPAKSIEHYDYLIGHAKEIIVVCEGRYAAWKNLRRNIWMLDNAHELLALWNGSDGGTDHCVKKALERNMPIVHCWPDWLAFK